MVQQTYPSSLSWNKATNLSHKDYETNLDKIISLKLNQIIRKLSYYLLKVNTLSAGIRTSQYFYSSMLQIQTGIIWDKRTHTQFLKRMPVVEDVLRTITEKVSIMYLPPLMYITFSSVRSGRVKLCSLANSANEMRLEITVEICDQEKLNFNSSVSYQSNSALISITARIASVSSSTTS